MHFCLIALSLAIFVAVASSNGIAPIDWLNIHNDLRAKEPAANMVRMVWNSNLANLATNWVNGCKYGHRPNSQRSWIGGYRHVGENIYNTTAKSVSARAVVERWYNEKADYTFQSKRCRAGKKCGHYTQVVWAKSCSLGCAIRNCGGKVGWLAVCNYGVAGNFNREHPYIIGLRCSSCPGGSCDYQQLCVNSTTLTCISTGDVSSAHRSVHQSFLLPISLLLTLPSFYALPYYLE